MVSKALPVNHPRASDRQRLTPKHSAAVRMQEKPCGFQSRSVIYIYIQYVFFFFIPVALLFFSLLSNIVNCSFRLFLVILLDG